MKSQLKHLKNGRYIVQFVCVVILVSIHISNHITSQTARKMINTENVGIQILSNQIFIDMSMVEKTVSF